MANNKANNHLIRNLSRALLCATALDKKGITINNIELEGVTPTINVEANRRLQQQMRPEHAGVTHAQGQRFEVFKVELQGTAVQWKQPLNYSVVRINR